MNSGVFVLEFLDFRFISTLVLTHFGFQEIASTNLPHLPEVLKLLTRLDDFGMVIEGYGDDAPFLLQYLFRNPSWPVNGRCKLRVHVAFLASLPAGHDAGGRLRILGKRVAGDDAPEWEVSESRESNVVLTQLNSVIEPSNVGFLRSFACCVSP